MAVNMNPTTKMRLKGTVRRPDGRLGFGVDLELEVPLKPLAGILCCILPGLSKFHTVETLADAMAEE